MMYSIIADSTFFICFLSDINRPQDLVDIIKHFKFLITTLVKNEISKSKNYSTIQSHRNLIDMPLQYSVGQILYPFFSSLQTIKGEHEVIAAAYVLEKTGKIQHVILDEDGPRRFIERNLPSLFPLLTGTIGFIGKCHCDFKIFHKNQSITMLKTIKTSNFRVAQTILDSITKRIQSC